jgi:UDP-N-acetylglucosamine 2-epimerase (non-hydrolysing)
MKKGKIVSIVGARPNFIKLAPIHRTLSEVCEHSIIHTGQHYDFGLSEVFFREFHLPTPNFNLEIGSGLPGYQVGEMIKKIEAVLLKKKFDLAVVYGDTNSTFAGAFAAIKANVNVAHVEAGLRSFDNRMPEERNRILTDSISEFLFAPTITALRNLNAENNHGILVNSGDISVEIMKESLKLRPKSKILERLRIEPHSYVLFTMHRAENTASVLSFIAVIKSFEILKDTNIIFPIHPRTENILREMNLYKKLRDCKNVRLIDPVGYLDFIQLMRSSNKIITDSGGIQKESYLLSKPCITIRQNTEWVETIEEGWNVLVGNDTNMIVKYVKEWYPQKASQALIFGKGDTSKIIKNKILEYLES